MPDAAPGGPPEWDLSIFYDGPGDGGIETDLSRLSDEARSFETDFKGRLGALGGAEFAAAIGRYEALEDGLGRVASYAELLLSGDLTDPDVARFHQDTRDRLTGISGRLVFFPLEIACVPDDAMERLLRDAGVARYRPWIEDTRASRPHRLSDEAEAMLHELSPVGARAWTRLFDRTLAGLRFEIDGETLTEAQALDLLSSADGARRRAAARELARVFRINEPLFALIANTLARLKAIEDGWRRFARPISSRNLANRVEDETVDALIAAVRDAYPRLSHRYYRMKARRFGADRLDWRDRNAPPPDDDRDIPWDEARAIVLDAFGVFSPDMAEIAAAFFEENRIDAPTREGKAGGAFSHPTVPSARPFVLLNYQGKARDVMTLAHELGHGVHQVLAADRGALLAPTPLTLAETASVFGERLAFRLMLDREDDPARRRAILTGKVEDMLNTVVRQIAFCDFERRVHDARAGGELTADGIGDIWMDVQAESLGEAVALDDDYRTFWCHIPHFVHAPFYVYAYAFGDCLTNALYARYREAEEGFPERFLDMLAAGGGKRHRELLAPFGLDASDPAFWSEGLGAIENFIDELEAAGG